MKNEFTLFLSGVEPEDNFKTAIKVTSNLLQSYWYIKRRGKDKIVERFSMVKKNALLVDSGAHTFLSLPEYQDKSVEYWEDYLKGYVSFVKKHRDKIFACVEMDIDTLVGTEQVNKWREEYFHPLEEDGIPVIYVYHAEKGLEEWERMCKRYPYVGFSYNEFKSPEYEGIIDQLFEIAIANKAKIHGFAVSGYKELTTHPYFSSDSTSVSGDSLITYHKGSKSFIGTIEEAFNILSVEYGIKERQISCGKEFAVFLPEGYTTPTVNFDNKRVQGNLYGIVKHKVTKDMVHFKTETGNTLSCTADHSVIIMDKHGQLKEISANDLNINDFLLYVEEDFPQEPKESLDYIITKKVRGRQWEELFKVPLSLENLEMLGFWVGDGCLYTKHPAIGFSKYHKYSERMQKFASQFGKEIKQKNRYDATIHSVALHQWLIKAGFSGKSHEKSIPSWVFQLSKEQKAAFLRGYFSADGCIQKHSIEYSTTSLKLFWGIKRLLETFGIHLNSQYKPPIRKIINGKYYDCRGSFCGSINNSADRKKFLEDISTFDSTKVLETLKNLKIFSGFKFAGVPIKFSLTGVAVAGQQLSNSASNINKLPNKFRVCRINNVANFSKKVLDSEVTFLRILDIKKEKSKEVEVYDLAVRNYEKFLANGFLVHNTWISGAQYGELNYFEGGKLKRLTKDKWKNEYYAKILDLSSSKVLLDAESPYELMRISALSYKKLEEYVNDIFRGRKYWSGRREVTKVYSERKLPDKEWFLGDMEDWREKLEDAGIDTSIPEEFAKSLLTDCFNFVTQNKAIEEYPLEELIGLCGLFKDETSNTETKCRKALVAYFTDFIGGGRDDLADLSEPEPHEKMAKERAEYIQEKEFIEYEMTKDECQSILKGLLTSGVKDEVDKALIEQGIEPIYDEKGNLKAGIKRLRKRKSISSDLMPELSCNICSKARRCPMYEEGMLCAYNKMFKQFDTRKPEDVVDAMSSIANLSLERLSRAVTFEKLDGGLNTKDVTESMNEAWKYLEKIQEIQAKSDKIVAERRVIKSSTGETEIRESVTGNPQGLLSELFKPKND